MNIELLEKTFLNYVAECCDMVVDKTVFRSEIPTAAGEGTAVIFNGIDKQNAYDMTAYKFQVLCRGKKRSDILSMYQILTQYVPCYGFDIDNIRLVAVNLDGTGGIYKTSHNGRHYWASSVNYYVLASQINS